MGIARHNPLSQTEIAKKGKDTIPSPFPLAKNVGKSFNSTWSSPRLSPPSSQALELHPSKARSAQQEEPAPQAPQAQAAVAAELVLLSHRTLLV